jgi:hypothetical protein
MKKPKQKPLPLEKATKLWQKKMFKRMYGSLAR